jgi:glycosidase
VLAVAWEGDAVTTLHEHRDAARHPDTSDADWQAFAQRFDAEFPRLESLFTRVYGDDEGVTGQLASLVGELAESWQARPTDLRRLDAKREAQPEWFLSNRTVGGVCSVDLYAGDLSGIRERIPYFVELGLTYLHLRPLLLSYREVDPPLGTVQQLTELAAELRSHGIWLGIDFIANHTSFQCDLNYSKPAVFRAMAGELLFLANARVDAVRLNAMTFSWKKRGTTRENLPGAHLLLQAFNAVCRIAAPSLLLESDADGHPDDVMQYISPGECQLSDNPLQMALIWNSLATREVGLLSQALERRHALPPGTSWVNSVLGHNGMAWTFADEDARELGIDGADHRRFLDSFYANRFDGSFARGVVFPENPDTGVVRVWGTTASLAGLEAGDPEAVYRIVLAHSIILSTGGIPLLYLGDEVGQTNDYGQLEVPGRAVDSHRLARPRYPAELYASRHDPTTDAGAIYLRLRHLIAVRKATPEFAGGALVRFGTNNPHVLGYQRTGSFYGVESTVVVLANFAEVEQAVTRETLAGLPPTADDLVTASTVDLWTDLVLAPHQFVWLRV